MVLTTEKNGTDLTVKVSGEVNTVTSPELSALLDKELPGVETLTLDFAECDYVSSAGLRVLLSTYKKLRATNGSMNLDNMNDTLMDVLRNTGLDVVFGLQ